MSNVFCGPRKRKVALGLTKGRLEGLRQAPPPLSLTENSYRKCILYVSLDHVECPFDCSTFRLGIKLWRLCHLEQQL